MDSSLLIKKSQESVIQIAQNAINIFLLERPMLSEWYNVVAAYNIKLPIYVSSFLFMTCSLFYFHDTMTNSLRNNATYGHQI